MTIIGIYAPKKEKKKKVSNSMIYQTHLNSVNKTDYLVVCRDFNARVGKQPIGKILGTNSENIVNENGKLLINFPTLNEFKTKNTFFRHKEIHKYTWSARGMKSIIDYVLANMKLASHIINKNDLLQKRQTRNE